MNRRSSRVTALFALLSIITLGVEPIGEPVTVNGDLGIVRLY